MATSASELDLALGFTTKQVVNTDGIRASCQQTLIGAAFVVVIKQLHPENDPTVLDRTLQLAAWRGINQCASAECSVGAPSASRQARRSATGPDVQLISSGFFETAARAIQAMVPQP